MIRIIHKKDCCGCQACVQRCPKQCISMFEDEEGFLYPRVNASLCIDCGLCEKVCPELNPLEPRKPLEIMAAKNMNEKERIQSSSGGVFFPLAKTVLSKGGVVFGALYDKHWEVVISYTEKLEEVKAMMGSKYLQARVDSAFQDAERILREGREVLFSGTPCQIAALLRYLQKDYKNLLTLDFICHGVPSPGVWRRYLQEEVYASARRRVANREKSVLFSSLSTTPLLESIVFRDKRKAGWKKFSFVVCLQSTFTAEKNKVLLSDMHYDNPYMRGFLADIYLRPSCYHCKAKSGSGHSDITVADFWGIRQVMPDFDDDKGVSLVLISTERGKKIFNMLPIEVRQTSLEEALSFNPAYAQSALPHRKRAAFYKAFNERIPLVTIIESILYIPKYVCYIQRVKGVLRRILCGAVKFSSFSRKI